MVILLMIANIRYDQGDALRRGDLLELLVSLWPILFSGYPESAKLGRQGVVSRFLKTM